MDRQLLAEECLRIEKRGGNVRDFLRSKGCISPWGTWFRLQKEELGRKSSQITEGKGDGRKMNSKLTYADRKEAVRIALEGGNPLEFLKSKGISSTVSVWGNIKNEVKKNDPETWEKLPKRLPRKPNQNTILINPRKIAKKPMKSPEVPEAAPVKAETPEMPVQLNPLYVAALEEELPFDEPNEPNEATPAITKPLMFDGLACREVEGKFGRYRYNCSRGVEYIDMENKDGLDVLSLTKDEWREFFDEVKRAGLVLGVEL